MPYGKIYGLLRKRVITRPANGRGPRRSTEYLKVAEVMRERIVTGDWPPNRRILSQHELTLIFGVGYLVTRTNRKGTYVRPPEDWDSR